MGNLVNFYHALQNMGMYINMQSIMVKFNVTYNYNYYNITNLCLSAQAMNIKVSKYSNKTYGKTGRNVKDNPKPLYEIVNDVISNIYINLFI